MEIIHATATELLALLESGQATSREITRAFLDQIERRDPAVQAFLRVDPKTPGVDPQKALDRAAEIDARRRSGKPVGRLGGLPVAIKDVLCTAGERTTCG